MATTKSKKTLTRLAWITELRRQGHRQCRRAYYVGDMACALGLLAEVAGCRALASSDEDEATFNQIGALAGLDDLMVEEVIDLNDGNPDRRPHTFAEIADAVAGWFPS